MNDALDTVVRRVAVLPEADLVELTAATRAGPPALSTMRTTAGSTRVREACIAVSAALASRSYLEVAGVIDGLRRARHHDRTRVDLVWSGPPSAVTTHRLTSATVADLIDEANRSVVLVSYAMHSEKTVGAALERAAGRHVEITLLAERPADNPSFAGGSRPFADLAATRLAWPAKCREAGASLHAKILAVDDETVLIGSANLTQSAMERNLECGILVRDRPTASAVLDHIAGLRSNCSLVRVT